MTFQTGELVEAYVRETDLQWPILLDPSLALYRAYGMERGSWWKVWGPPAWWIYAKLIVRGRSLRRPVGDMKQLGGDVLIDPKGIIRFHHVSSGPGDRPSIASLLSAVSATSKPA